MELAKFTLFKNCKINDLNNTLYFPNNETRDKWFTDNHTLLEFESDFNFIRDKSTIKVSNNKLKNIDYFTISNCNYGKFEDKTGTYYFFIMETNYGTPQMTILSILIDGVMTYCQGTTLMQYLKNSMIDRQHLTFTDYNNNIRYLTHNTDTLYSGANTYNVFQKLFNFNELYVIIQSSCKLHDSDFGNEKAPKTPMASGLTYDGITSPLNLYCCSYDVFKDFQKSLQDYSWIAQNITKVVLVPKTAIDDDDLADVDVLDVTIKRFKDNHKSKNMTLETFKFSWSTIYGIFGLDMKKDKHLLRYPYCFAEVYTWNGQKIQINFEDIENDNGLEFNMQIILGFHNQIAIYPILYNSLNENTIDGVGRGDYLNNAIIIDTFDDVPILVDNYKLGQAKQAYRRELTESRLLSGRIKGVASIADGNRDIADRLYDVASLTANLNPAVFVGSVKDEYNYWKDKNAEINDSKQTTPTITSQTNSNNFQIKNNIFGVTIKFKQIDIEIIDNIRNYHKLFGFQMNKVGDLNSLTSMSLMNFLKCNPNHLNITNCEKSINEQIKVRLENGLNFWNYPFNQSSDPFISNIINNAPTMED